jgi:hypothetical protein
MIAAVIQSDTLKPRLVSTQFANGRGLCAG